MDITWYGDNCIGCRERGVTVLCDPFTWDRGNEPASGENTSQPGLFTAETDPEGDGDQPHLSVCTPGFAVDIVVSSLRVDDTALAALSGEPKVIAAPGEFESRGVFVQCLPLVMPTAADEALPSPRRLAHYMDFSTVTITHLGTPGTAFRPRDGRLVENLVYKQTEILVLSLGTGDDLDMDWALKTCQKMDPRICIPVGYAQEDLDTVVSRLQTMGPVTTESQKRYRVKKDGADEGTTTILLSPSTINRP